jgi:tRNA 2-thiocytidine biosynthesis protein TtcA
MVSAIAEFQMLEEGDRVLVAVSGGKDSTILLLQLEEIRKRAPFSFSLHPVLLDQVQPGFEPKAYSLWLAQRGLDLTIISQDTYSIVTDKTPPGKNYCGLCSRLRRGALYSYAHKQGYTKIALGHHRDDLNETLLLNMFFVGQLSSMPPKLLSDDGRNTVIRPLCTVPEQDLIRYAEELEVPVIPCNLCGSQPEQRRGEMKALLSELDERYPGLAASLLTAQRNLCPSQLMSQEYWNFGDLAQAKRQS